MSIKVIVTTQAHYPDMGSTQTSKLGCRKQPSSAGKLA
jgi:hypothetical protein